MTAKATLLRSTTQLRLRPVIEHSESFESIRGLCAGFDRSYLSHVFYSTRTQEQQEKRASDAMKRRGRAIVSQAASNIGTPMLAVHPIDLILDHVLVAEIFEDIDLAHLAKNRSARALKPPRDRQPYNLDHPREERTPAIGCDRKGVPLYGFLPCAVPSSLLVSIP